MHVSNWKPLVKNTLRGFFSLTLPSGMILHNCSLHEKNGHPWIGLPSRRYSDKNGATSYMPIVEFTDRKIKDNFDAQVLQALERMRTTA